MLKVNATSHELPGVQKRPHSHSNRCDRFIPGKTDNVMMTLAHEKLTNSQGPFSSTPPRPTNREDILQQKYNNGLSQILFNKSHQEICKMPINHFGNKKKISSLRYDFTYNAKEKQRPPEYCFPEKHFHQRDLPGLVSDVYLNNLSWSRANMIAIGLSNKIYGLNFDTKEVSPFFECSAGNNVHSMTWIDEKKLAFGDRNRSIRVIDTSAINSFTGLCPTTANFFLPSAANVIERWTDNDFFSGNIDGQIQMHDIRRTNHNWVLIGQGVDTFVSGDDICSLKVSPNGNYLAAGNGDNTAKIYDLRNANRPLYHITAHRAGVLALVWQSNKTVFTGGGNDDHFIRAWNMTDGKCEHELDTKNQVTSLQMSAHGDLISTHGYHDNSIRMWNISSIGLTQTGKIKSHTEQILYSAMSPQNDILATASEDETLRFWEGFHNRRVVKKPEPGILSKENHYNLIR